MHRITVLFFLIIAALPVDTYAQIDSLLIIDNIFIDGNKVTKVNTITRELMIEAGDTIQKGDLANLIEESVTNLKNLSIFNFQEIHILPMQKGHINLLVELTERWYIFPSPYLQMADRNVNAWLSRNDKWRRINYGALLYWKNFRGRAETLDLMIKLGYDQHFELDYDIPYFNKAKTLGINFGIAYLRSHQINVNTFDNKEIFYPTLSRKSEYAKQAQLAFTQLVYRRNIHTRHLFTLQYSNYQFSDSVLTLNPSYSFERKKRNQYLGLSYTIKYDFRDYIHYPLKGYYLDFKIHKRGLGLLLSPNSGDLILNGNARRFLQLSKKFYFASGFVLHHSIYQNTPYFKSSEIGNMFNLVRGYENYSIRGQSYFLFKNNVKYELVKPTTYYYQGVREEFGKIHYALYMNLFSDLGYMKNSFSPELNPMGDRLLIGGGIGLDLVTYYDKVLRLEFSYHKNGYWGIYIHYIPSI